MIRKTILCVCLLLLCTGNAVQAGALSGDGNAVSMGQTQIRAQVVTPMETSPKTPSETLPAGETKPRQEIKSVKSVKSGDASEPTLLLLAFALNGWGIILLLIQFIKRRRL